MSLTPKSDGFRITGWHVLFGLVAFFGVVIAINAVMIMDAYRTYPGEAADQPYKEGLAFDSSLGRRQAQASLGWRMTAGLESASLVRVAVFGPSLEPLTGLRLAGTLERPATEVGMRTLAFRETSPGVYDASTAAHAGAWDLKVTALDTHGRRFDATRRLIVP